MASPSLMRRMNGAVFTVPETWLTIGPTVVSNSSSPLAYDSEPRTVRLNNDDLMVIYRQGSAHSSNDGVIAQRISSDDGASWGAPSVIADDVSGYDTRNQMLGIDRASGRVILFYSVYNAVGASRGNTYYQTSSDNGSTWSSPASLTGFLGSVNVVPFGRVVETSNGLMATFYGTNKCYVLFSLDGGQTWGSPVTVYDISQAQTYNEPTVVAVDADRIVIASRVDKGGASGYYNDAFACIKSSDGGLTWGSPAEVRYKTTVEDIVAAAPADLCIFNGKVFASWISRHPDNRFYFTETDKESFFTDPTVAFATATAKEFVSSVYANYATVTTGTVAEYGYPYLQDVSSSNQNLLCLWYDMADGTSANTKIMSIETPTSKYAQTDPTVFYTMDNVSGTTLVDESVNGIDGTITGATQRPGQIGQELYFDGSDYVSGVGGVDTFAYMHNRCDFTISFIASLDTPDGNSGWCFLGSFGVSSTEKGFSVYWDDRSSIPLDKTFRLAIGKGSAGTFAVNISIPLSDTVAGQRYHWMIYGDRSNVYVYRDNVLVGSQAVSGVATGSATRALNLGRMNATSPLFPFLGAIEQLRIYPHASGQEARLALFNETGL